MSKNIIKYLNFYNEADKELKNEVIDERVKIKKYIMSLKEKYQTIYVSDNKNMGVNILVGPFFIGQVGFNIPAYYLNKEELCPVEIPFWFTNDYRIIPKDTYNDKIVKLDIESRRNIIFELKKIINNVNYSLTNMKIDSQFIVQNKYEKTLHIWLNVPKENDKTIEIINWLTNKFIEITLAEYEKKYGERYQKIINFFNKYEEIRNYEI